MIETRFDHMCVLYMDSRERFAYILEVLVPYNDHKVCIVVLLPTILGFYFEILEQDLVTCVYCIWTPWEICLLS